MERYHAASVLSLTARGALGTADRRCHFVSDLRDDVDAGGFLRGRRGPPNNGKPTSGARGLASITGQGGEAALL